ncbi:MAG: LysR family transcriptional regulator [Rubrivivax sp.]|nr:LysR family transcriptional regulator [Rubrivivax sp.]
MDLKQLEYFVQVAELGSFTRASEVLRVAQPALSRQVRALEVELRLNLFHRNGRGVALTEPGQRLLAHGRGILQQVQRARVDLEEARGAPVGRLALGVPPTVGRLLTSSLVQAFREQLPRATLTMVEGLSTYVLEWLAQGRIDMAVVYNAAPSAALDLVPVLEQPLMLVSRRNVRPGKSTPVAKAVPLRDVAARELVIPSRPHAIRMRVETALAAAGLRPRVALEIESVPAILDLVEQGGLAAVLTRDALVGREATLLAQPIRAGRALLVTSLWIATSAQRPRGPLLERGAALVQAQLKRLATVPA